MPDITMLDYKTVKWTSIISHMYIIKVGSTTEVKEKPFKSCVLGFGFWFLKTIFVGHYLLFTYLK